MVQPLDSSFYVALHKQSYPLILPQRPFSLKLTMAAITAVAVALAMTAVQVTTALPTQGGKFIVGGTAAKEGDFPYIVAALLGGAPTAAHCGGTLLNANTVLTAAHCTEPDLSRLQIRAGSLVCSFPESYSYVGPIGHVILSN